MPVWIQVFNECKSICRTRDMNWILMSFAVIYDGFFLARVSYELLRSEKVFCEILRGFKMFWTSSFIQKAQKLRQKLDFKKFTKFSNQNFFSYSPSVLFKSCGISLLAMFVFFTHVILSSNNSRPSWHWQTYELSVVATQISVHRLSNCWQMFSGENGRNNKRLWKKRDRLSFSYFHCFRCCRFHECQCSNLQWYRPMAIQMRSHLLSTADSWNRLPDQFCKLHSNPCGKWELNGEGRKRKMSILSQRRFTLKNSVPKLSDVLSQLELDFAATDPAVRKQINLKKPPLKTSKIRKCLAASSLK